MATHQSHSMFDSAQHVYALNSNLISGNITLGNGRKAPFDIMMDNVTRTAFHNSGTPFDPPKCHPNTRVAVLKKIMDWIRDSDSETRDRYILWLTGPAGAGKSAIAQTIIELCLREGLFIAGFFFFRSDSTRNHAKSFVATLAYQLHIYLQSIRDIIQATIENDPVIFARSLEHQFDLLIIQPLRKFYHSVNTAESKWRRLIVIDGLDECVDSNSQRRILSSLGNAIRKYKLPVIFLVASRPEHDIKTVFAGPLVEGVVAKVFLDDTYHPDDDIRKFLQDSFKEIRKSHPFNSRIPRSWPTSADVESIVEKSSGQFIYGATAVEFVQSTRHEPHRQLAKILSLQPLQSDLPFRQLDELYTMILSSANDIHRVLFAISVYSLQVDFRHFDIAHYMSLDKEDINILFCDLGALVSVEWHPYIGTYLEIHHASLHDFLLDPIRSKEYFISADTYRTAHVTAILKYITPTALEIENSNSRSLNKRIRSINFLYGENFSKCDLTPEIMHAASSFPLEVFTEIMKKCEDNYNLGILYYGFLPLIRRMAHLDPQWSSLEARTLEAVKQIILSQISWYYEDQSLTPTLCLLLHAGKTEYVPGISRFGNRFHLFCPESHEGTLMEDFDPLSFWNIDFGKINTDEDTYRRLIISWLQDPNQSGEYAMGPTKYSQATEFLMDNFRRWEEEGDWVPETSSDEEDEIMSDGEESDADEELDNSFHERLESDLFSQVKLEKNVWVFEIVSESDGGCWCPHYQGTFLNLGYIIFLLPLCGKSERILEHCQNQGFLTDKMLREYPKRIHILRQAMQDYINRFAEDFAIGR